MAEKRKYICVMFDCCNVYNRIYVNKDKTAYVGWCPGCMRRIRIAIGKEGTSNRFFNAK